MNTKEYLGDGTYVDLDYNGIVISFNNGVDVAEEVSIDSSQIKKLLEYINKHNLPYNTTKSFPQETPYISLD